MFNISVFTVALLPKTSFRNVKKNIPEPKLVVFNIISYNINYK